MLPSKVNQPLIKEIFPGVPDKATLANLIPLVRENNQEAINLFKTGAVFHYCVDQKKMDPDEALAVAFSADVINTVVESRIE